MKQTIRKSIAVGALGLAGILAGCSQRVSGIVVSEAHAENESKFAYTWSIVVKDSQGQSHPISYATAGIDSYRDEYKEEPMRFYAQIKALDSLINVGDKVAVTYSGICEHWQYPQKMNQEIIRK